MLTLKFVSTEGATSRLAFSVIEITILIVGKALEDS
jgi:hypothetical protein